MSKSHFQVILMAGGKGSRMTDLSNGKPKCLLPVGNFPMIYYPLSLLKKVGFTDVIVITQESAKNEVNNISKKYELGLTLDIVALPSQQEDCGTADALRRVHDKITAKTIFVLSCDLFSDFHVHQLMDLHRIHGSSVTSLFSKNSLDLKKIKIPGPQAKVKKERDFIGIDMLKAGTSSGQLCLWNSEADLGEEISLKQTVMREHPNLKVFSNLMDAHFYIFEKWVVDFIAKDDSFSALKGEVLPYLVKKQFSKANIFKHNDNEEEEGLGAAEIGFESFIKTDDLQEQKQQLSSWNDHSGDLKEAYHGRMLRCFAYVIDGSGTCLRCNTMQSYWELNQQIGTLLPSLSHNQLGIQIHPNANVQAKAQVGLECFVGENTVIAEKTTIKNCIIGANCQINEKVRLTNCIVMNNVTISSLNNISGSIICDDVKTSENCEVKDCIISKGHHVGMDGVKNHANKVLGGNEGMMMEI